MTTQQEKDLELAAEILAAQKKKEASNLETLCDVTTKINPNPDLKLACEIGTRNTRAEAVEAQTIAEAIKKRNKEEDTDSTKCKI